MDPDDPEGIDNFADALQAAEDALGAAQETSVSVAQKQAMTVGAKRAGILA